MSDLYVVDISDPTWNSRLSLNDKDTKELAASMQARINQGKPPLINPILVSDAAGPPHKYELVAGSRRLAAARLLGLETIQATVETFAKPEDKVLDNIVENLLRKDLSTYEEARACAELRKAGLKLTEVQARTGISNTHVSKLVKAYEGLVPEIKTKWQAKSPIATTDFLSSIASLDIDEQVKAFNAKEAAYAEYANDGEDEEGDSNKPKKKPVKVKRSFTVKREVYDLVLTALKKVSAAVVTKQMMIDSVMYLVGEKTKIDGVNPFPDDGAIVDPTKKKEKSTKKKGK